MVLLLLLCAAFQNALVNLDIEKNYRTALADLGFNLEQLYEFEHDPALGNGGLGELVYLSVYLFLFACLFVCFCLFVSLC